MKKKRYVSPKLYPIEGNNFNRCVINYINNTRFNNFIMNE